MTPAPLATVLLDPPTTLMAGAILALVSMKLISRSGLPEVWHSLRFALGWSLMYPLAVGWHFFFRPDWMFVYLVDTQQVPLVPAYVGFTFVCVGFGAMGYLSVALLLHLGRRALAWAVAVSSAASLVLCTLLTTAQYSKVGTWAQYQAGTAVEMMKDGGIVTAWAVSGVIIAATSVGILGWQVRRTLKPAP